MTLQFISTCRPFLSDITAQGGKFSCCAALLQAASCIKCRKSEKLLSFKHVLIDQRLKKTVDDENSEGQATYQGTWERLTLAFNHLNVVVIRKRGCQLSLTWKIAWRHSRFSLSIMFSVHDQSGNVKMKAVCQINSNSHSSKTSSQCSSFLLWAWRQRKMAVDVDLVYKAIVCHESLRLVSVSKKESSVCDARR